MASIIAQDVFQRKLYSIFLTVPGVMELADDMIISISDDQQHGGNLLNLLEVCRNNNLTLNAEKMQFRLPKVSFFGHTWSDKGLSPDPKKIEAVERMEMPQDLETMRSILGLINYLNRFSPCLAELSDPLQRDMQAENGIQAYKSLWSCFSMLQRWNFQECNTSLL